MLLTSCLFIHPADTEQHYLELCLRPPYECKSNIHSLSALFLVLKKKEKYLAVFISAALM